MTWFKYENYGTVLQAVALCKAISASGYESELIDYRPRGDTSAPLSLTMLDLFHKAVNKLPAKLTNRHLRPYSSTRRRELFDAFVKDRTTVSEKVASLPELSYLSGHYHAVVCGSDQVWSPNCFDRNYFLPFVDSSVRRIAYAPSFGTEEIINTDVAQEMAILLRGFGHLSVRELSGAKIVKSLIGKTPPVVLDPTLLFDSAGWNDILGTQLFGEHLPENGYVLCYFLGDPNIYIASAKRQAECLGLPLVVIPSFEGQTNGPDFEVGPAEFIRLFQSASYVCTDSFHGTAFAVNFGIPFTTYKRFKDTDPRGQNTRITSFLGLVGLSDRLSAPSADLLSPTLDFKDVHTKLAELRAASFAYLSSALIDASYGERAAERSHSVSNVDLCCGCGACAAICPKAAVHIDLDRDGFQRCFVDEDECVDCGLCSKVCPIINPIKQRVDSAKGLFSYKSFNRVTLDTSSSGGFGFDVASHLANDGFKVFGCVYDRETDSARHVDATDDIASLQGSKYIQSESAAALALALERAVHGDKVAFFGTPCQVAGFDALLRRKRVRERVVLVDLICHGVPTALLWRRYLAERCERGVDKHPAVQFRSKINGWSPEKTMVISSPSGNYSAVEGKDDFYAFFSRGLCYSWSCYECPFRERSAADLRMGDYWGSRFSGDREGVSMVIAMTQLGINAVKCLSSSCAAVNRLDVSEYWSVQFPYNKGLPLRWQNMIDDFRNACGSLSELRKKYCAGYDQRDRINKVKCDIRSLFGGSC